MKSAIIGMLERYCDLLVSTGTETVPHTGKVIWTGLVKQMEYVRVCEQIQRLRAEASGWQPIETAPKDGRRLLLGSLRCCFMGYRDDIGFWRDQRDAYRDPTHWMPLPAPPAVKESLTAEKSSVIRAPQRGGG